MIRPFYPLFTECNRAEGACSQIDRTDGDRFIRDAGGIASHQDRDGKQNDGVVLIAGATLSGSWLIVDMHVERASKEAPAHAGGASGSSATQA